MIDDLRYRFKYGNMVVKLIYVNMSIFLLLGLMKLGFFLFQNTGLYTMILQKISLPASLNVLLYQPWSIFSYMFLHEGLFHILFNMLWLYWFGEIFISYLGDKRILPLYLIGGLSGALLYLLSFNFIPVFKTHSNSTILIGASASILAIVFGIVTLVPNHSIRLLFFGNVRIKYIAFITLVIDIISIPNNNAGGYIAHLGGALSGFLFMRGVKKGIDISQPINKFAETVVAQFSRREAPNTYTSKTFSTEKKIKQNTVQDVKFTYTPQSSSSQKQAVEQAQLDSILDKISRSGYDSLSEEEKKFLFEFSNKA